MRIAAAAALAALVVTAACARAEAYPTCSAFGMSSVIGSQHVTARASFARSLIAAAAASCDYARLEHVGRENGTFRFGPGSSASAYWRHEEELGHRPLASLIRILRLPYALLGGAYVWPSAARPHPSPNDWALLVRAGVLTGAEAAAERSHGNRYTGWRAAVTPDGDWVSFTRGA